MNKGQIFLIKLMLSTSKGNIFQAFPHTVVVIKQRETRAVTMFSWSRRFDLIIGPLLCPRKVDITVRISGFASLVKQNALFPI
jgi:hypothetical protein